MKKYLSLILFLALGIPSVAFASWWNPFTWFKRIAPITQSISSTTQPTIEQLSKKIEILQKQIDDKNSTQTQTQETSPNVIQNQPKQSAVSVQADPTLKVAQCQAEKQQAYNVGIQTFEREMQKVLAEVKAQLAKNRDDRVAEIYAVDEKNIAHCESSAGYSPSTILSCIQGSSAQTSNLVNSTVMAINTAWVKKQKEAETNKQIFINQMNPILDQQYISCLNK